MPRQPLHHYPSRLRRLLAQTYHPHAPRLHLLHASPQILRHAKPTIPLPTLAVSSLVHGSPRAPSPPSPRASTHTPAYSPIRFVPHCSKSYSGSPAILAALPVQPSSVETQSSPACLASRTQASSHSTAPAKVSPLLQQSQVVAASLPDATASAPASYPPGSFLAYRQQTQYCSTRSMHRPAAIPIHTPWQNPHDPEWYGSHPHGYGDTHE